METVHLINEKVQRGEVIFIRAYCKLIAEPGLLTSCQFSPYEKAEILKKQLFMKFII